MTRFVKTFLLFNLLIFIVLSSLVAKVSYTPSLSLTNGINLTSVNKLDFSSYHINIKVVPLSISIDEHEISFGSLAGYTGNTNVIDNILLQGFTSLGYSLSYNYTFNKNYALGIEAMYLMSFHQNTNNAFPCIRLNINNFYFLNRFISFSLPLGVQYRNGFYDVVIGFCATTHFGRVK